MSRPPLAVFPADPESLKAPLWVRSGAYRNRADLVELIHVEARADAEGRLDFTVATESDGVGPDRLSCRVDAAGDFMRLCAALPTTDLKLGDLVHLQWVARVRSASDQGARSIDELLLTSDESRAGKLTADRLGTGAELAAWTRSEALLQVVATAPGSLLHLTFLIPSDTLVEIAGIRAEVCGWAEPLEAKALSPALAQARRVRPIERTPYAPGESLFRSAQDLGFLLAVRPSGVRGWAMHPAKADRPARLALFIDEQLHTEFEAPPPTWQADRLSTAAFHIELPPEALRSGSEHRVDVRFADSGEPLRGSPGRLRFTTRLEGMVEYDPVAHAVVGWAVDQLARTAPAQIEVLVDGVVAGVVEADAPHPVLTGPAYRRGRCGFRFALAPAQAPQTVDARLAGVGVGLPGGPLSVRRAGPRVLWGVEALRADGLDGWATDRASPDQPVRLQLTIDGLPYAEVVADRPTRVEGRLGFSCIVPHGARSLGLNLADTGERLGLFNVARSGDGALSERVAAEPIGLAGAELAAPAVDQAWYFAAHPVAATAVAAGAAASAGEHWLRIGGPAGLSPTPWFDEGWYRRENPDVAAAIEHGGLHSGFAHWQAIGAGEGRRPGPGVDPAHLGRVLGEDDGRAGLRRWLADPERQPGTDAAAGARPRRLRASPPRGVRGVERRTPGSGPAPIFETMVDALLRDLEARERGSSEALRAQLAQSEAEISRRLREEPPVGDPLVSVVMPTYNRAFVIAEAIQSVVDQSWTNWELLVCDDGSTDRTSLVVAGFADPRVRYLKLEKANGAAARNRGLSFSRGDFLAFLDSDNIWHPDFLAVALGALARRSGSDLLYAGFIDTQTTGARFTQGEAAFRPFDYRALLRRNYIDLNTLFVRRSVYEALGGFDEQLPRVQDWDLVLKYAQLYEPFALDVLPAFYRRNLAWGQVTDLYAHMNFNQIVRDRATARLEMGQPRLHCPLSRRVGLSIVAGDHPADGLDGIGLARLAQESADVRLFLPDTPDNRRLAGLGADAERAPIVWFDPADGSTAIIARLWGEAVVLCDRGERIEATEIGCGAPTARLLANGDVRELELGGDATDRALLGALPPWDAGGSLEAAAASDAVEVVVVCPADEAPAWRDAVRRSPEPARAVVLVALGAELSADQAFRLSQDADTRLEWVDLLRIIRSGTDVLIMRSPAGQAARTHPLYVAPAMAAGALIVCSGEPGEEAERLLADGGAQAVESDDPGEVLTAALALRTDAAAAAGVRGQARFRYLRLYRPDAVAERLKLALVKLVEGAAC